MTDSSQSRGPWLLELASEQTERCSDVGIVYDEGTQMSHLREPAYRLAIGTDVTAGTKKADRETGEDQKGF